LRPPDNKIFICQRTDKVVDVWKGLIKHNFLSVPVLQKTKSKYYGFVDIADIVLFFVEHFGDTLGQTEEDYWKKVAEEQYFQERLVRDVMKYPLTRRNPFHPVIRGYSLFYAIEALAREPALHRVPILDESQRLVGLITQSQVIQFLFKNLGMLGEKKNKPLSAMTSTYSKEVFSIGYKERAIDAFRMMVTKGVSGLAVLDDNGVLVNSISVRDLKTIGADARLFWRLYQTVNNFLAKEKKEFTDKPRHPIFATPQDTLEDVIKLLATKQIHRLFVVDGNHKPIGIISLKDVLLEIISV